MKPLITAAREFKTEAKEKTTLEEKTANEANERLILAYIMLEIGRVFRS